jgi:hypothetical protein
MSGNDDEPPPAGGAAGTPDHTRRWKDSAELETYKALVSLHNAQETIFWTRNNILAVIQTALIAGAFSVLKKGTGEELLLWDGDREVPATLLCVAGLTFSVAWILVVRRTDFLFRTTLHILANMELRFRVEGPFHAFGLFVATTRPGEREIVGPVAEHQPSPPSLTSERLRLAEIWLWLGRFFIGLWLVALCMIWREYPCALLAVLFACGLVSFMFVSSPQSSPSTEGSA